MANLATKRILSYFRHEIQSRLSFSSNSFTPQICIVGSGPAGFYTAQQILKSHKQAQVDIYEMLPAPYGLVRYGVAPDHPEVKNVIHSFEETAKNSRCQFLGNVNVGKDISIKELQENYHAVVLTYGAATDRILDIPGEDAQNVLSARAFVGWYNSLPENCGLTPDLSCETAVVVGMGNVALDVARILLSPISLLEETDISSHALEALQNSKVKNVHIIGRRGPMQVAFTIKEFREILKLPDCKTIIDEEDVKDLADKLEGLSRPRKRLTELIYKHSMVKPTEEELERRKNASKTCFIKFLRTPLEIVRNEDDVEEENSKALGIRLGINEMKEDSSGNQRCLQTGKSESMDCGLILRAVGYQSTNIDTGVPFDENKGIIQSKDGRVEGYPGLYCGGWVSTGPVGVILNTMANGFQTGNSVINDIKKGLLGNDNRGGKEEVARVIGRKGIRPVFFEEWLRVDQEEVKRGEKTGKPRVKMVKNREMLNFAWHKHG